MVWWAVIAVVVARATRRPFKLSVQSNVVIISASVLEVFLISVSWWLTGLPTSDLSLFYYLPIVTSAEFLRLRYIPVGFLSVLVGLVATLSHFYSPGNGWDLAFIGLSRVGFLVTTSVLSVLLTRLQSVQNQKLANQNLQITELLQAQNVKNQQLASQNEQISKLLAFQRQTGQFFAVSTILDLTLTAAEGGAVRTAGVLLKEPSAIGLDSPGLGWDRLPPPFREEAQRLVDNGIEEPKRLHIGDREFLAVPLHTFNTFRGVLFGLGDNGSKFPPETEDYLSSVAEIAGMGIARARAVTLLQEIARAPFSASANDALIDWLLRHLTDDLGFDFAAISAINPFRKTISMIRARNVEPGWSQRTNYPLDDKDMLADVVRNAERAGSDAAECIAAWDARFDEVTYNLYGHSKLVRFLRLCLTGRGP
jgi:hypothetical protein